MKERLQKILSARGVASRRKAEELILAGRVTCNGSVCGLGDSADPDVDIIRVDGKLLPSAQVYVYIMLHKPRGYVTTLSDEKGRKNAAQRTHYAAQACEQGFSDAVKPALPIYGAEHIKGFLRNDADPLEPADNAFYRLGYLACKDPYAGSKLRQHKSYDKSDEGKYRYDR